MSRSEKEGELGTIKSGKGLSKCRVVNGMGQGTPPKRYWEEVNWSENEKGKKKKTSGLTLSDGRSGQGGNYLNEKKGRKAMIFGWKKGKVEMT